MAVLVTGGAGYIGSHTVVELLNKGHQVIVIDDLSNSKEDVIDRIEWICGKKPIFYRINACDKKALYMVFENHSIGSVIHFAGYKAVGESVNKPLEYYKNNIESTIAILEVMRDFNCNTFVFSSSATVYGPENPFPYTEEMPALQSLSPYGWSKVMNERILIDYAASNPNFSSVLLRYFNPIGAHESALLGDDPNGTPNNIMPYICQVAAGKLDKLIVFGNDYPTPDGTCQRDYLHVVDLADGHIKALEYAQSHLGAEAFNLGTGCGTSVLELIKAFNEASNMDLPYEIGLRRSGDLPAFWADPSKAKDLLGWETKYSLIDMCRSAWQFAKNIYKG